MDYKKLDNIGKENQQKIMIWKIVEVISLFPFVYSVYLITLSFVQSHDLATVKDTALLVSSVFGKVYIISIIGYYFAVASINEIKDAEHSKFKNAIKTINESSMLGEK